MQNRRALEHAGADRKAGDDEEADNAPSDNRTGPESQDEACKGKNDSGERKHQSDMQRERSLIDDKSDGKSVQQSQADADRDTKQ